MTLFSNQPEWARKGCGEMLEKRPWGSLQDYVSNLNTPTVNLPLAGINFLLGEKKHTIQRKMNRLMQILGWVKSTQTVETVLLSIKFIEELIELLLRVEHLLMLDSFDAQVRSLDQAEKKYFGQQLKRNSDQLQLCLGKRKESATYPAQDCQGIDGRSNQSISI